MKVLVPGSPGSSLAQNLEMYIQQQQRTLEHKYTISTASFVCMACVIGCEVVQSADAYSHRIASTLKGMPMVQVSYRSYWTRKILQALHTQGTHISIKDISDITSIRTDDIVTSLQSLNLIKYWKGDHIIAVTTRVVDEHVRLMEDTKWLEVDAMRLHWEPFGQKPDPPGRR